MNKPMRRIVDVVCGETRVDPAAIHHRPGRRLPSASPVLYARQIVMALGQQNGAGSNREIAAAVGMTDPSQVTKAALAFKRRRREAADFDALCRRIETALVRAAAPADCPPVAAEEQSPIDHEGLLVALEEAARRAPDRLRAIVQSLIVAPAAKAPPAPARISFPPPAPARPPVPPAAAAPAVARTSWRKQRHCLGCGAEFVSEGPHNRQCNRCRSRADVGIDADGPANLGGM